MPDDLLADADLGAHLVREAGSLAARMLRSGIQTSRKSSLTDLVTTADRAAEALVVSTLEVQRPEDGILGEEGAAKAAGPGQRVWVIDPVDGTYNFAHGLTTWCSAVALQVAGRVVVGAVYQPATDELWVGGPGLPTTHNGVAVPSLAKPKRASASLGELSAATYLHPTFFGVKAVRKPWEAMVRASATLRMSGSGSVDLAGVASGRLGIFAQHSCPLWDRLPGAALVLGAGGTSTLVTHRGYEWHVAGPEQAVADATAALTSG